MRCWALSRSEALYIMTIEDARRFAEKHFPNGPEKLAGHLGIRVCEGQIAGCDGWVLSGPAGIVIRLSSTVPATRRRFTLAHELGHLLLGVPTVVGESVYESLRSNSAEERQVNDLAAELLLPAGIVRQHLPAAPIVTAQLRKLAKTAGVSELAAAIRVANLAREIGLVNASVIFFRNDAFEWHWSRTLRIRQDSAEMLLKKTRRADPKPVRIPQSGNQVIVSSMIANPLHNTTTLFVQLLPAEAGNRLSSMERRQQLEEYLFKDDNEFRMRLQGVFGAFRPKCAGLTLDMAIAEFYKQKGEYWTGARRTRLHGHRGREYVRLRLQPWCS
jgi:uncharacterized protein DUF955